MDWGLQADIEVISVMETPRKRPQLSYIEEAVTPHHSINIGIRWICLSNEFHESIELLQPELFNVQMLSFLLMKFLRQNFKA